MTGPVEDISETPTLTGRVVVTGAVLERVNRNAASIDLRNPQP